MKATLRIGLLASFLIFSAFGYPAGKRNPSPEDPAAIDPAYLNSETLVVSKNTTVQPSPAEREWGIRSLDSLKLEGLGNSEKASRIQKYVTGKFKYRIRSPRTIQGMIDIEGGNCVSHTIMGLFLLRLAGVPAKVSHELQLWNPFFVDQIRANSQKAGYFGSGYNSHYWVLFFDGADWQPYDSALDLTGFEAFFQKRTATKRWPYLLSLDPQRMTGPPFVIEKQADTLAAGTVNITAEVWARSAAWNNQKVTRDKWMEFVGKFEGKGFGDFVSVPDKATRKLIRKMARKWF